MDAVRTGTLTLPPAAETTAPARSRIPQRALVATGLLAAWVAMLTLLHHGGHNAAPLLRDPATMAGMPVWHGALSTLGCMAWALTGALCLATHAGQRRTAARTWLLMAALALALGVDDALMLHEEVLPGVGLGQELVFLAYGAVAVLIVRDVLARPADFDVPLLAVACSALAVSIGLDVVVEDALVIYEDGPKVFGVVVLAVWAYGRARATIGQPRAALA